MSAVLTSPEDIINAALVRLGSDFRVGSLQEGSRISKAALDTFGQWRDDLLRKGDWGFARRDVNMTLLKSAPADGYVITPWEPVAYPPLPWKYAYEYPSDCLKVRSIRAPQLLIPTFLPYPVEFDTPNTTIEVDEVETQEKVITCNVAHGILTYTGQILDVALWEATFCNALIAAYADLLAPMVNPQMKQAEMADEQMSEQEADVVQG